MSVILTVKNKVKKNTPQDDAVCKRTENNKRAII